MCKCPVTQHGGNVATDLVSRVPTAPERCFVC